MDQPVIVSCGEGEALKRLCTLLQRVNYPLRQVLAGDPKEIVQAHPALVVCDSSQAALIEKLPQREERKFRLAVLADGESPPGCDLSFEEGTDPLDALDAIEDLIGAPPRPKESGTASGGKASKEMTNKVESLEARIQVLEGELAGAKKDRERLTQEKEEALESLKKHYQPKMAKLAELEEEASLLRSEQESAVKERGKIEQELRQAQQEGKKAASRLEREIEKLQKELERAQAELVPIQEERDQLAEEIKDKEDKHHKAIEALREFYRPKVERMDKLAEENKEQAIQMKDLQRDLADKDAEIKKLQGKVGQLQMKVEEVREVTKRLKSMLQPGE